MKKYYLCRTLGVPSPPSATLNSTIQKDSSANKSTVGKGGKPISTTYKVLSHNGAAALVEIELHTGRSHQIRAQMAALGHPLLGDGKYGAPPSPTGQCLVAYKLKFNISEGLLGYLNGKEIILEGALD